jgi:hypothetical protein
MLLSNLCHVSSGVSMSVSKPLMVLLYGTRQQR